jgi:regulatory protein
MMMRDKQSCVRVSDRPSSLDPDSKELSRARNTAYRYLSFRPRSRAEVEQRLNERGFPGTVVHAVLLDLDRLGYLNDREFARQWAGSRIRLRGLGRHRIEQELRDRGVDRDIIHEALAEVFEESSEMDVARREAEKKLKGLDRYELMVRKRRAAGLLERKGFSSGIIHSIIRDIEG